MADEISLEQMITELGGSATDTTTVTENTEADAASTETPPAPETTPPPAPETTPPLATAPTADAKAQHAFETMRLQNKKYVDTLKSVSEMLGIPSDAVKEPEKLLGALQQKTTEFQADKQKVPVELLTRLQQLEERDQAYVAQQREAAAALGFQRVKDTFGLDDAQLNNFAAELLKAGSNPLEQTVDLMAQYKVMHFEELQAKAVADAIAKEQERAARAANQSTTPGTKQGAGGTGEPTKVNSVQELNRWLEQNVK